MRKVKAWLFWLIVVMLSIFVAWACFSYLPKSAFRDNFLGDGIATLIGALIGIPIALWLSRRQQKEQEEKEKQAKEREASERKTKILELVRQELEHNHKYIVESRTEIDGIVKREVQTKGFKNELWMAFSDGGEIEWIKDLQLLHFISYAYHNIKIASHLEHLYLQYKYYPGTYVEPRREEGLIEELIQFDSTVLESITEALEEVNKSLVDLENTK